MKAPQSETGFFLTEFSGRLHPNHWDLVKMQIPGSHSRPCSLGSPCKAVGLQESAPREAKADTCLWREQHSLCRPLNLPGALLWPVDLI